MHTPDALFQEALSSQLEALIFVWELRVGDRVFTTQKTNDHFICEIDSFVEAMDSSNISTYSDVSAVIFDRYGSLKQLFQQQEYITVNVSVYLKLYDASFNLIGSHLFYVFKLGDTISYEEDTRRLTVNLISKSFKNVDLETKIVTPNSYVTDVSNMSEGQPIVIGDMAFMGTTSKVDTPSVEFLRKYSNSAYLVKVTGTLTPGTVFNFENETYKIATVSGLSAFINFDADGEPIYSTHAVSVTRVSQSDISIFNLDFTGSTFSDSEFTTFDAFSPICYSETVFKVYMFYSVNDSVKALYIGTATQTSNNLLHIRHTVKLGKNIEVLGHIFYHQGSNTTANYLINKMLEAEDEELAEDSYGTRENFSLLTSTSTSRLDLIRQIALEAGAALRQTPSGWELVQLVGLNYFTLDLEITEDHMLAGSLVFEYTPLSNVSTSFSFKSPSSALLGYENSETNIRQKMPFFKAYLLYWTNNTDLYGVIKTDFNIITHMDITPTGGNCWDYQGIST